MTAFTLSDLEQIVESRAKAAPEDSWTAKLVAAGQRTAAEKLGEEAVETVIAAVGDDRKNLVDESADLLYHLKVVVNIAAVPWQEVMNELARRTSQSGLQEKANRQNP